MHRSLQSLANAIVHHQLPKAQVRASLCGGIDHPGSSTLLPAATLHEGVFNGGDPQEVCAYISAPHASLRLNPQLGEIGYIGYIGYIG